MAKVVSFRRCHICNLCSEGDQEVRRCIHCGKPFAPFFYFNARSAPVQADYSLRPIELDGERRPIQGLTAYWEIY